MKHNNAGNYIVGYIALVALAVVIVLAIISIFSPKFRKKVLRPTCITLGGVVALFLALRGIAGLLIIDY
ncbi:MAG: hypothetical protein HKL80_02500 [Acidimicrobiales bacterium]|nr:hypothetical protein [Acidimicrobiales bacterium]